MSERKMKVVYVAGPFSGADAWEIHCNVHCANTLARDVARLGAAPLTPHAIGAHFHGTESYEFWCAATLEMMRRCDAVVFVEGWEFSRGSVAERQEAACLGIPCFFDLPALAKWLSERP